MSFQSMTWAVEQELPAMQKIVLLMLANRTNHDTGLCFPSHDRLAKDCGMTSRSVINQVEKLERSGLLTVIRESKNGVKQPNKYRLNMPLGSERDSVGVVNDVQYGSERDSVGVVKEIHINQELLTRKLTIPPSPLTDEMKNCFDWAQQHPFWKNSVTSISKFLEIYGRASPNGLKAQYQNEMAKQSQSNNEAFHATHQHTHANPSRKLTPAERVAIACGYDANG